MQAEGRTLSKYYVVDSLCCPSRSAIFTGRVPARRRASSPTPAPTAAYDAFNRHGDQQKCVRGGPACTGRLPHRVHGQVPERLPARRPDARARLGRVGRGRRDGYPEFDYTLNENGKAAALRRTARSDYLVDVLSAEGRARSSTRRRGDEQAVHARGRHVRPARAVHAARPATRTRTLSTSPYPQDRGLRHDCRRTPPSWLRGHAAADGRARQATISDGLPRAGARPTSPSTT